jgi:hypothetical protein
MAISRELRRVARALASAFTLNPRTDYLAAYPRRTPEELIEYAWSRTAADMNRTIHGYARRVWYR